MGNGIGYLLFILLYRRRMIMNLKRVRACDETVANDPVIWIA